MPFVSNMPDDEQKTDPSIAPQGAVAPIGGNTPVRLSPAGAVAPAGGSGPGSPTPGSATTPSAGGQFASLQNYLSANQGQAAPLAGKITGGINNEYNNLSGQNISTLAGVGQQVNANAAPDQATTNATIAQEAANPVSFANNPSNVASFQNLLNASYTGPASVESTPGYTTQQSAINNAISAGQNATGTEAGREGLLSQNEATPTSGVTALNSAILSQDPNALSSIENAYQPFNNLLTGLQTGAGTIDKQIAQNQANATGANTASNAAINSQINALNNNLTSQAAQDEATRAAYNTGLSQFQNQWNPINSTINSINELIPKDLGAGAPLINSPLGPLLAQKINNNIVTPQTLATPDQYAQAQAFQNLVAGLNLGNPTPIINQSTVNQAGTANIPVAFNTPNANALAEQLYNAQNIPANPSNWTNAPGTVEGGNNPTWNEIGPQFLNLLTQLNAINPALPK